MAAHAVCRRILLLLHLILQHHIPPVFLRRDAADAPEYLHENLHSAAFQLAAQIVMKVSTSSLFCSILKARSYTTKHGEVSRKNSLVLDSMKISVSSTLQAQISGSVRPYTKNCFNSC